MLGYIFFEMCQFGFKINTSYYFLSCSAKLHFMVSFPHYFKEKKSHHTWIFNILKETKNYVNKRNGLVFVKFQKQCLGRNDDLG